jgi:hypothetical protein
MAFGIHLCLCFVVRCPECRADVDLASCPVSSLMRKRVARMTVRCRKHKEGCKEQFTTGTQSFTHPLDISRHVNSHACYVDNR